MERKIVRYHIQESVSAKTREVNAEFATLGVGEFPTGPAVAWLQARGIDFRGNPVLDSMRAHEHLTDAICATIPAEKRTEATINEWLEAPKIAG